jgi:large subunit ribosomal protein L3
MGKHAPRRGSLQFWPRVRSKRETARVRRWATNTEVKPLGFLGYKANMCHVLALDNRPKSITKDEEINIPATIIECPPMKVAAINIYNSDQFGSHITSTIFSKNLDKELSRILTVPKKEIKTEDGKEYDDVRLVVYTQPKRLGNGTKKPKLSEIALGGKKEDKLAYAKEKLGKEITIEEVFKEGNLTDIRAITTGKGFQGPVKRHGIMIRSHKSEKSRRANIRGSWTGVKMWTVPHSAKMGYNQRVEYNKWIMKLGTDPKEIERKGGVHRYGVVKNPYLIIKGSVGGPKKRVVTLTSPIRPQGKIPTEAPTIKAIIQ